MMMNLGILLGEEEKNDGELLLPTEEEIITMLREGGENIQEIENADDLELNETYAVIWEENSLMNWFVGFALSNDNDGTTFEYLERLRMLDSSLWQYPRNKWKQLAYDIQILPIKVECEWDYSKANKPVLQVTNYNDIQSYFDDYIATV